jgi:rhodanese-related sulfurtransferase
MSKVFQESTLSKLPKDKPIIVCCRLGARSAIVTMGLRDIGFSNVFNLKHGIKGTMDILTPKATNQ